MWPREVLEGSKEPPFLVQRRRDLREALQQAMWVNSSVVCDRQSRLSKPSRRSPESDKWLPFREPHSPPAPPPPLGKWRFYAGWPILNHSSFSFSPRRGQGLSWLVSCAWGGRHLQPRGHLGVSRSLWHWQVSLAPNTQMCSWYWPPGQKVPWGAGWGIREASRDCTVWSSWTGCQSSRKPVCLTAMVRMAHLLTVELAL